MLHREGHTQPILSSGVVMVGSYMQSFPSRQFVAVEIGGVCHVSMQLVGCTALMRWSSFYWHDHMSLFTTRRYLDGTTHEYMSVNCSYHQSQAAIFLIPEVMISNAILISVIDRMSCLAAAK